MPADLMKLVHTWLPLVLSAIALYLGIRNDQRLTRQLASTESATVTERRAQELLQQAYDAAQGIQSTASLVEIPIEVSDADRPAAIKLVEAGKAELKSNVLIVPVNRLPLSIQNLDRDRPLF